MKYWAYVNNEILGPFEKEKLLELPSFSPALLVCPQTPVGEKTEDWKEANTYPEIAAMIGGAPAAAPQAAPAPTPAVAPAPEPVQAPQPAIETTPLAFKPLGGGHSIDPVPPASHSDNLASISISQLKGTHPQEAVPAPAPAPAAQASAGFDPISLSTIARRTETLSGQELPKSTGSTGLEFEPHNFSQAAPAPAPAPAPALDLGTPPAFAPVAAAPAFPAPEPAPAPAPSFQAPEPVPAPAAAPAFAPAPAPAAAPAMDMAAVQALVQRLDSLAASAATRRDIDSAVDPLRLKLDQMGEVISSIKNSQFQREVIEKLGYLESSVSELKEALRRQPAPAPAAAPAPQELKIERNSDTVFGVQPAAAPKQAEKPKEAPKKEAAKVEIKDEGSKPSRIVPAIKKLFKFIITIVLLVAVLLGAVIGLKKFGVFDATKFLPPAILSQLPFLGGAEAPAQTPAGEQVPAGEAQPQAGQEQQAQQGQQAGEAPAVTPEQQEAQRKAAQEQVKAAQQKLPDIPPEAVPEVIYITRTYKLKPNGNTLENKIYEHAAKAGGNPNGTKWNVRATQLEGSYEVDAVIEVKNKEPLTYTCLVDRAKKTVVPVNEGAVAAFDALVKDSAKKGPAGRKPAAKAAAKPGAKAGAKPAAKAAAEKAAAADEEYEYVYEDEEGN